MPLTNEEYEELTKALISAFPDESKLEQMLRFRLDKSLNETVAASNLTGMAFELVKAAEAEGWTQKLVRGALETNSDNPKLKVFAEKILLNTDQETDLLEEDSSKAIENIEQGGVWNGRF